MGVLGRGEEGQSAGGEGGEKRNKLGINYEKNNGARAGRRRTGSRRRGRAEQQGRALQRKKRDKNIKAGVSNRGKNARQRSGGRVRGRY